MLTACSDKPAIVLETVRVERGDLSESVTATGTVESVTQVDVGTQVTGIIDKLYADYNSVVQKGELIAEIEKTLLESDLKSADANMESARITYEYTLKNYNRDKALHDKDLISDYEYETSLKDYNVAKQTYDKSKADRVRAAKNLNYAEIYSPIDGVVISRDVEVGQTVVSNMSVANLYTIADLDNMQVIGDVDEADIGQVKVGQKVTFTVDAFPDNRFEGSVTQVRLSPTTESNVVTYEVVVSTDNPDHKLIPGMTANLTIYIAQEKDILLLPTQAFKFNPNNEIDGKDIPHAAEGAQVPELQPGQKHVWVVQNGTLTPKAVTVGVNNGITAQILGGLTEGEEVASGYGMTAGAMGPGSQQGGEQSPFAPKPPSRNKKK